MTNVSVSRRLLIWPMLAGVGACGGSKHDLGPHPICTGEPGVRLAARIAGGGPSLGGEAMQGENGWQLLIVDGNCHAWALSEVAGHLRQADLDAQGEARLAQELKVETWKDLVPSAGGSCFDAPGLSLRFGDVRRDGPTCGGGAVWEDLAATTSAQVIAITETGASVEGDLRYLVIAEAAKEDARPAVTWPLATSLMSLATDSVTYTPGHSRAATGDDATALRAIRTIPERTAANYYGFTRVSDGDGRTYQVYMRDALPFEQENGLVPDGTF